MLVSFENGPSLLSCRAVSYRLYRRFIFGQLNKMRRAPLHIWIDSVCVESIAETVARTPKAF